MTIDYIKLSPTGNITLLVTTPVPRAVQSSVAGTLLERVGGEQVGYVEAPGDRRAAARLQMMGGEFCGNATMSLGAVLARRAGIADGDGLDLMLEVSGSATPVPCHILRTGDGWTGTVRMPLPTAITRIALPANRETLSLPLVRFPGIAHLILSPDLGLNEASLRTLLPDWNRVIGADALGALLWDEARRAIDPLVYVPSAGTLVREHGCGSGTAAVGCWLADGTGATLEAAIRQPGGTIAVSAAVSGSAVRELSIRGRVDILAEGTLAL